MDIPSNILSNHIQRGAILHSTMFDEIDHGKYFVVIGVSEKYIAGFFFINSNIHPTISNKPEQLAMQYPLKHSDYNFLKYDSFLCATNIIKRPISYITESLESGNTRFIGNMKKEHLKEVLEKARLSRLFSQKDKEQFFYE